MNLVQFKNFIEANINQGIEPSREQLDSHFLDLENKIWWDTINLNFLSTCEEDIEEVIIHENGNCFLKRNGDYHNFKCPLDQKERLLAFKLLTLKNGMGWNFTEPFASFYMNISSVNFRATLIHPSCTSDLNARAYFRFISRCNRKLGSFCTSDQESFIRKIIDEKKNTLICGATGSGKTTFLSTVINNFSKNDHHLIIEDTKEINCNLLNTTSLLASKNNNKDMKSYLTYAMRMSPDRIIMGELRSSEVTSYLLALNTGHRGSWSTVHANGPIDAIDRICLLFNLFSDSNLDHGTVKQLACNAIDYVIHIKDKKVNEMIKIINYSNGKIIYESIES